MTTQEMIIWGCVGGAVPDVLRLIKVRHERAPKYLQTWFFWCMLALLVVIGGAVAYASEASTIKAALALGFSGPQVLSSLIGKPNDDRSDGGGGNGLWEKMRGWWAI